MKNPETGRSRGFGFVTYKDPSCVEMVIANGPHSLDGRTVLLLMTDWYFANLSTNEWLIDWS